MGKSLTRCKYQLIEYSRVICYGAQESAHGYISYRSVVSVDLFTCVCAMLLARFLLESCVVLHAIEARSLKHLNQALGKS
jgi:hypothetical protein